MDLVFVKIFKELFVHKDEFINNLLEKSMTYIKECMTGNDMQRLEEKIEKTKKERKKLIKLYTTDLIDEKEFEEENNIYNDKINKLEDEYNKLNESRNLNNINQLEENLRKSFQKDMDFNLGVPDEIIDKILDKIEVERLEDNGLANLEIFLSVGIRLNILYKKKKIIKYIEQQKVAS